MPITAADEMMCHQIVSTFDHVETSDLQWTERHWFTAFETSGKFFIGSGLGKYTNRSIMDAAASLIVNGTTQYNVRASRALYPNVDATKVGPISYETLEPLKRMRVSLDENEYGVSFDLEFEAVIPVSEQNPQMFHRHRGRLVNHMCRFFQAGRASGWLKLEGKTYDIKKDTWVTFRDRSWGLRSTTAKLEPEDKVADFGPKASVPSYWHFFVMQFNDFGVHYEFAERPEGGRISPALGQLSFDPSSGRRPLKVVDVKHEWDFVPGTSTLRSVHESITTEDGALREVDVKPLSVYYRRTGGYGTFRGWTSGLWMGPNWTDGERMDLAVPKVLEELHGVDDYAIECRYGDEIGYGVMEPWIRLNPFGE